MLRYNPRLLVSVGSGSDRMSESETLQSSKRFDLLIFGIVLIMSPMSIQK